MKTESYDLKPIYRMERRSRASLDEPLNMAMWLDGTYMSTPAVSLREALSHFAWKLSNGDKTQVAGSYRRMASGRLVIKPASPEVVEHRLGEHRRNIKVLWDLVAEEGNAVTSIAWEINHRIDQIKMLESMAAGFDYSVEGKRFRFKDNP